MGNNIYTTNLYSDNKSIRSDPYKVDGAKTVTLSVEHIHSGVVWTRPQIKLTSMHLSTIMVWETVLSFPMIMFYYASRYY